MSDFASTPVGLKKALLDYDSSMLRALAETRGIEIPQVRQSEMVETLAEELASPVSIAITLTELSDAEEKALSALVTNGGYMEVPRFARSFGAIRPMGPARLEREKPWLSPVNPAEWLWYRGLIFAGFRQQEDTTVEVVYIPAEVLKHLPEPARGEAPFEVAPPDFTPSALPLLEPAVEDTFTLLAYFQNNEVAQGADGSIPKGHLRLLRDALRAESVPVGSVEARLEISLHYVRRTGLLAPSDGGLLRPDPEVARPWMQSTRSRQARLLFDSWREDPDWDDLCRVPSLHCRDLPPMRAGARRLLARTKILGYLARCEVGRWLSLFSFVQAIKEHEPDFQRPDGDYESWYVLDDEDRPLIGYENWEKVEGALIEHVLTFTLAGLGVVESGQDEMGSVSAFRLGERWASFVGMPPLPGTRPRDAAPHAPMAVGQDMRVRVPPDANLYDRFQLSRFADFEGREADRLTFRLTPQSIGRVISGEKVEPGRIISFLRRVTDRQIPEEVEEALANWGRRPGSATLRQAVVLQLDDESLLDEVMANPRLAPMLAGRLGPRAALVQQGMARELRSLLVELGYIGNEG